jgi:energy-coupling factor transport system permease protein
VRLGRVTLVPTSAALLLAGAGAAALLARHSASVAALAALLFLICLRAPARRRRVYLFGAITTGLGVLVVSPFLAVEGVDVLWRGPTVPVLGPIDVTSEEIEIAAINGVRLTAVGLAFAAYALLLDHDRLVAAVPFARRSALAVALATRLVPTLERDAAGLVEAIRGRGVELAGVRGRARLLSPLVAGSLERASNLAEAMEARGFGRPGATRAPRASWSAADRLAAGVALSLVCAGVLWL